MISLTESLNVSLNESKNYSVKSVKAEDVVTFLRQNPEYYFYTRGIGSNAAHYGTKGKLLDCEIQYQPKAKNWYVYSYSNQYTGGFEMDDDKSIDSIDSLVSAIDSADNTDIKIGGGKFGIYGTYDFGANGSTPKAKIQLRKKK